MGIKEVTYCDGCGDTESVLTKFTECIGTQFDGHRNEDEVVSIHLCKSCASTINRLVGNISGSNMMDTTRFFKQNDVFKILLMLADKGYLKL